MYSVFAAILLVAAFAILVVTFLWVGRLLGLWSAVPPPTDAEAAPAASDGEPANAAADEAAPAADGESEPVAGDAEEEEEDAAARGRATILGANYGLVLGILACILFKVSWLMLMLSAAGIGYSSRALYQGFRYYRIVVYRALIGLVLGILSVGLQYLELTGRLAEMMQLFAG